MAPASTSKLYRLPGRPHVPGQVRPFLNQFSSIWRPRFDSRSVNWLTFLFMTREEAPPLDSDLDQGAGKEANSPAGGARGGWRRCGVRVLIFFDIKILNSNISAFSGREGRLARSLGLCVYSRES